jgi:hypothetical protein
MPPNPASQPGGHQKTSIQCSTGQNWYWGVIKMCGVAQLFFIGSNYLDLSFSSLFQTSLLEHWEDIYSTLSLQQWGQCCPLPTGQKPDGYQKTPVFFQGPFLFVGHRGGSGAKPRAPTAQGLTKARGGAGELLKLDPSPHLLLLAGRQTVILLIAFRLPSFQASRAI